MDKAHAKSILDAKCKQVHQHILIHDFVVIFAALVLCSSFVL